MTEYEAGRELDALIAEMVMAEVTANAPCGDGLTRTATVEGKTMADCDAEIRGAYKNAVANGMKLWPAQYVGPAYSTDMADAWLVVEKLREGSGIGLHFLRRCEPLDGAHYAVGFCDDFAIYLASAATAPLALCLAALKVVSALPVSERREGTNG